MSLVLYLVAIAAVVVCVLFGLGYWHFAGMDGPRNGGFPYPRDEDLTVPDSETASDNEQTSPGQAPLPTKVAWAPTVAGAHTAPGVSAVSQPPDANPDPAGVSVNTPEAVEPDTGSAEGTIPPQEDAAPASTGDDGAPTAHIPDLSD